MIGTDTSTKKLYFNPIALRLAWERMIRSTARDTKDYFGIELFNVNIELNLSRLSELLLSDCYKPSRPFKYYEPKPAGTHRTKTVLSVEDSLVYQAIGNQIGYKCYHLLAENNNAVFGSVLHPEVEKGEELMQSKEPSYYFYQYYPPLYNKFVTLRNRKLNDKSIRYKLETDITGFFDSIPHSKLLYMLSKHFSVESEIVSLLGNCLNAWSGTRDSITPGVGIPQGPPASHVLANLFLHDLDNLFLREHGFVYFRFMDDIRIYDKEEDPLNHALVLIDKYLKDRGVSVNTQKTSVEKITDIKAEQLTELVISEFESSDLMSFISGEVDLNAADVEATEIDASVGRLLSPQELQTYCEIEITTIENQLRAELLLVSQKGFDKKQLRHNNTHRHWTQGAYKWRNLNQLRGGVKPSSDESMLEVWFFGLEHFFWKANHFCWNLNQYGPNDFVKTKLLILLKKKFKYYEWVRYQIVSSLALTQEFKKEELFLLFNEFLVEEESAFVRLAYYKLILNNCNPNNSLWDQVLDSISKEKGFYIKNVATHAISNHNSSQLFNIKNWFGL